MRPSFTIKFLIAALLAAVQTALALDITSADDFPVNESASKISITTEILVGPENLPDDSVLIDTQKTGVVIGGTSTNKGGSLIIDGQGQSMSVMELSHDYSTTSKFYYMKEFTLTNLGNSEPDYDDLEDSGTNFGIFGKRNTRTTTGVQRSFLWSNVETVNITNNVRTISDSQNKDVAGVLSAGQGLQFSTGKDLIIDNNKTISTQGTVKGGAVHTALTYTGGGSGGGALQIQSMKTLGGHISLSGNAIELAGDKAAVIAYGGAAYAEGGIDFGSTSTLNIKVDTNICNNTITRVCEEGQDASGMVLAGGAFHAASIRFVYNLNNTVSISGNGIDASNADGGTLKGGAFCIEKVESDIKGSYGLTISNNSGNIDFTGNYIKGNESADIKGGAIYFGSTQAGPLKISNNTGDVVSRGNYESDGETTVLHSLYADLSNASNTFEWSAAEGHSIEVHDSITLTKTGSQKVLTFNKNGSKYETGTLLFSGEYTEEDLAEAKGEAGTAAEIKESRTSRIEHMSVNMQSGTLKIEKGAALVIDSTAANTFSTMELVLDMGELVMTGGATFTDVVMNVGNSGVSLLSGAETPAAAGAAVGYGLVISGATGPLLTVAGDEGLTINFDMTGVAAGDPALLSIQNLGLAAGSKPVTVNLLNCDSIAGGATYNLVDIAQAGDGWLDALNTDNVLFTFDGVENAELAKNFQNENGGYMLSYEAPVKESGNTGSGNVPEPGTATLSLLALAGLLARRRRRGCQIAN